MKYIMLKALRRPYRALLFVLLFWVGLPFLRAQQKEDAIHFDLLTCSPGTEVYELYGHTALRVSGVLSGQDFDEVYNYGCFDFSQPHFIWNFILGHTDYMVQRVPYRFFVMDYKSRGSSITAQRLNLTPDEAMDLLQALETNVLPQNSVYRYNFLTNNCTTKVRDMIEESVQGEVRYDGMEKMTFRQCLKNYTDGHPWAELGNDMLLGANVDTILTNRNSAFLPERLMEYYSHAVVYDIEGNARPLLSGDAVVLLEKREVPVAKEFPLPPTECVLCFAALCLLIAVCEYRFRYMIWFYDLVLMLGMGLCGMLVTFIFFFSEHPTVDSNWQIWLFNPIPLFCMPWVVWRAIKRQVCIYHVANMACLMLFLAFSPWISQDYAVITIPLACCLLTRPLSYYLYYNRTQGKGKPGKGKKKTAPQPAEEE